MSQSDHPDARWFPDAGLGLFVHWGIASAHGSTKLSWGMVEDHHSPADAIVSPEEYHDLAEEFDPEDYEPDRWLAAARKAGMEYAVLTAVHHDGFTLWPSEYSDFGVHTHLDGRDLVSEYVDACRRQGLKVGLYVSPEQWFHEHYPTEKFGHWDTLEPYSYKRLEEIDSPAELVAFEEYFHDVKGQLEELMTEYGRIDAVWFDHSPWFGNLDDRMGTLVDVIESAQPGAVINARDHFFKGYGHYDADAENELPDMPTAGWSESCQTWGEHWGYVEGDDYESHAWTLRTLAEAAGLGSNLLLNVGPKADGTLPDRAYDRLSSLAGWMTHNSPAVKGVEAGPWPRRCEPPVTREEGVWYLHVLPEHESPISLRDVPEPAGVRHLRTSDRPDWTHEDDTLTVELPEHSRETPDEVLAISWPEAYHHLL